MSLTVVHNISDRAPNVEAHAISIGGVEIRPGKFQQISTSKINSKHKALHGSILWFGKLPDSLNIGVSKSKTHLVFTKEQAKAYLNALCKEELVELGSSITPIVTSTTKKGYVYTILNAIFNSSYDLDPKSFFWLGKWKQLPNGDYLEL